MSGFEPIKVTYLGEEKTIPADNFLIVLAEVEEVLSFTELNIFVSLLQHNGGIKVGKILQAYIILLRAAGFKVSQADVMANFSLRPGQNNMLGEVIGSLIQLFERLMQDAPAGDSDSKKKPTEQES